MALKARWIEFFEVIYCNALSISASITTDQLFTLEIAQWRNCSPMNAITYIIGLHTNLHDTPLHYQELLLTSLYFTVFSDIQPFIPRQKAHDTCLLQKKHKVVYLIVYYILTYLMAWWQQKNGTYLINIHFYPKHMKLFAKINPYTSDNPVVCLFLTPVYWYNV